MSIFSIFKSKTPEIIKLLNNIKKDLLEAQKNIEATLALDQEISYKLHSQRLIQSAVEGFGVALWIKDLNNHFTYANRVCCSKILKCKLEEAITAKDSDFDENSLASACMKSDTLVLDAERTKRFIEHGIHADKHIFLDTIKSPLYFDGTLTGTMGSGRDITAIVPNNVKEMHKKSCFTEVPIDIILCEDAIIEYLKDKTCEKV